MILIKQIHNPHDNFFKKTMEDLSVPKGFINNYLPAEITNLIDLNSLEIINGNFVDGELKESFTDMLYKANLINQQEIYLYFLFEHKSKVHQNITLQLLKYMLNIWELLASKQTLGKLPIIIPLLIYHGRHQWNVGLKLTDILQQIPNPIQKHVPNYEYILYDLSKYTSEDIKGEIKERLFLEVMVNIFKLDFDDKMLKILQLMNELEQQVGVTAYIKTVMKYIIDVRDDLTLEKIIEIDKKHSMGRSDLIMTLAEQLRSEGMQIGVEKGIGIGMEKGMEKGMGTKALEVAKKMLAKGMLADEVAELTELPKEEVEKLQPKH